VSRFNAARASGALILVGHLVVASSVSAQVNIAPCGTATQSSGWNGDTFPASLGIDGELGNFTHTSGQEPAIWEVDLGAATPIESIVLLNRGDGCCQERLRDIVVSVHDQSFLDDEALVESEIADPVDFDGLWASAEWESELLNPENELFGPPLLEIVVGGAEGRYVRITRLPDLDDSAEALGGGAAVPRQRVLSLGEVEIWADELPPMDLSLELRPQDLTVPVGSSIQLAANAVGDCNVTEDLTAAATGTVYSSDPPGIVSIGDDGLLTGEAVGETTVTATNGELSATTTVTVRDDLILVRNPGFEEPELPDGEWTETSGLYWTLGYYDNFLDPPEWIPGDGNGGVWDPDTGSGFTDEAFAGENAAWAASAVGLDAGLTQVLDAELEENTAYELSVQIGNPFYNESEVTAQYRLELLAGGVLLASDTGDSPLAGVWEARSLNYDSADDSDLIGEPLEIRLIAVEYVDGGGFDGYEVDFDEVELTFSAGPDQPRFRRGDTDDNAAVELTDAVRILGFLFQGGETPGCFDAADADDNGRIELTDAVRILGFLFQGTAPPPPPGPVECGADPLPADELGCESYESC